MQHAAAIGALLVGELRRDLLRATLRHDADALELRERIIEERRRGRALRERTVFLARERGDELDEERVRVLRERSTARPRERRIERFLHERAREPIEHVDAREHFVSAHDAKTIRERRRRDRVRRRHALLLLSQVLDRVEQHRLGGRVHPLLPHGLIKTGRRHAGRVTREAVEPAQRVRNEITSDARAFRNGRHVGPRRIRFAPLSFELRLVITAADDDDRFAVRALARGRRDEARHHRFARLVARATWLVPAEHVEVANQTLFEIFDGRGLLEEVIPERVGVFEAELVRDVAEAIRVLHALAAEAVLDAQKRVVPRRQIHPHRLRLHLLRRLHRDELG